MCWLHDQSTAHVVGGSATAPDQREVQYGQHGSKEMRGEADADGVEYTEVGCACGEVRTRAALHYVGLHSMHHFCGTDCGCVTH